MSKNIFIQLKKMYKYKYLSIYYIIYSNFDKNVDFWRSIS